jgi:hypothetical protein
MEQQLQEVLMAESIFGTDEFELGQFMWTANDQPFMRYELSEIRFTEAAQTRS